MLPLVALLPVALLRVALLPPLERALLSRSKHMNLYVALDSVEDLMGVVERMKAHGIRLYDVEMGKEERAGAQYVTGLLSLRLPENRKHTEVVASLATLKGVAAIEEV